jgi:hypothetical protein
VDKGRLPDASDAGHAGSVQAVGDPAAACIASPALGGHCLDRKAAACVRWAVAVTVEGAFAAEALAAAGAFAFGTA